MSCAVCVDGSPGTCDCYEQESVVFRVEYYSEVREHWFQEDPYHPGYDCYADAESAERHMRFMMPRFVTRIREDRT
jgi:hypothetical protein